MKGEESARETRAPNQKITREEVRQAIIEICDKRGVPVVRSNDIVELEWVSVGRQAVNNHLEALKENGEVASLSIGPGAVWWVPEEGEPAGDVDVSAIHWEGIDPMEIPAEIIKERPEVDDPTYWERMMDNWGTIAGGGIFFIVAGILIAFFDQYISIETHYDFELMGATGLLVGVVVIVVSLIIILGARLGQFFENIGFFPIIRRKLRRYRDTIYQRISEKVESKIEDST